MGGGRAYGSLGGSGRGRDVHRMGGRQSPVRDGPTPRRPTAAAGGPCALSGLCVAKAPATDFWAAGFGASLWLQPTATSATARVKAIWVAFMMFVSNLN